MTWSNGRNPVIHTSVTSASFSVSALSARAGGSLKGIVALQLPIIFKMLLKLCYNKLWNSKLNSSNWLVNAKLWISIQFVQMKMIPCMQLCRFGARPAVLQLPIRGYRVAPMLYNRYTSGNTNPKDQTEVCQSRSGTDLACSTKIRASEAT
jgi:hypothetical protein